VPRSEIEREDVRAVAQEPINVGDRHYDPVYPCGVGWRPK
jgi:hypothetical protein